MNRDTNSTFESLKQLDQRQEQLLKELDELNLRIEKVLSLYQASRGTSASVTQSVSEGLRMPEGLPKLSEANKAA